MGKIVKLISGGQSGADRGAMDAAVACGVPVGGWCPAGGWAEDLPEPPGVLALYPQMKETPLADVAQRTEWNIRDATYCIVFNMDRGGISPGTDAGYAFNEKYGTPYFTIFLDWPEDIDMQVKMAVGCLHKMDDDAIVLSVGGPRASEYPGIYDIAFRATKTLLEELA